MPVLVDAKECVGCGICVSACPVQAISIIQNKAFIDQNMCNECLQCISECPNDAIYQTSDKEISVAEAKDSTPYSVHQPSPQFNQVLGVHKREQRIFNRRGGLFDRIREVASTFFQDNSSFDRSKKGGRKRHGGHRRRYRGGRFKH